jgi:16S rRNA (guanine527-N7)-methyltransferase
MTPAALRTGLQEGAQRLGVSLSERQLGSLLTFQEMLLKWGRVYNLTAVHEPAEVLTHHLLDSLAVVVPLQRYSQGLRLRVLDVGSGAGLPGVVLAVCCPELIVTCVDTVAKKSAFVKQVAAALGLPNLRAMHARVESLNDAGFDLICSRAFASLANFTSWSRPALAWQGVWMAMKGKMPEQELPELSPDLDVFHVERLDVPGLNAERCLIWIKPVEAAASSTW